ncbi:MAG: ComEC/Rec2 family competence protein [Treponema sp.]|uniref:ComEC/Rec2 family competence protein n=1 Tax=Treponema sp. TaxID=166 RepID=UPI003FA25539
MEKIAMSPIMLIAGGTASVFYGLYTLAGRGIRVSSFVFLIALTVVIAGIVYQLWKRRMPPVLAGVVFIMAGMVFGSYAELRLRVQRQPPRTLTSLQQVQTIIGELSGEPAPAGTDFYRIPVRLIACNTSPDRQFSAAGMVELFVPAGLIRGTYAGGIGTIEELPELVKTAMTLHATAAFVPFLRNAQPCRFYAQGLKVLVQGRFSKTGRVFYARPVQPVFLGWSSPLNRIRAILRFAFMRMLYGWGNAGGLLLALLAADKTFLPPECTTAFRNAGLAHILALSGMHLSLISTAALQGGSLFGHKKRAIQASLVAICAFVWFAGSAPSLNRALGMVCIAALGRAMGLKPPLFAVLCTMLTVHITFAGSDAVTLGFLLSYGACAGIILFGDSCAYLAAGKIPPAAAQSLSASIGAQLFTLPIVIGAIGSVAAAGIIASCVVSPMVSFFLMSGLITIPLALIIPQLSPLLGTVLNIVYDSIFFTADLFARMPQLMPETAVQRIVISCAGVLAGIGITAAAHRRFAGIEKTLLS